MPDWSASSSQDRLVGHTPRLAPPDDPSAGSTMRDVTTVESYGIPRRRGIRRFLQRYLAAIGSPPRFPVPSAFSANRGSFPRGNSTDLTSETSMKEDRSRNIGRYSLAWSIRGLRSIENSKSILSHATLRPIRDRSAARGNARERQSRGAASSASIVDKDSEGDCPITHFSGDCAATRYRSVTRFDVSNRETR